MTPGPDFRLPSELAWALLIVLSVLWVSLGRYWGRRAVELDGFILAGRRVGMALGAGTAVATWITSNTILLAPQFALEFGVWGMLAYSTASLGLLGFAPLAARIRRLMPDGHTAAEFMYRRYGESVWIAFMIISMGYALAWLVSMVMAGGLLLEALSGIDYLVGMSVIVLVCTLYTLAGGLYAVIGTDFAQSLIVLIGLGLLAFSMGSQLEVEAVHAKIQLERPMLLQLFFPAALIAIFNNLMFGLGEVFHSNVWWSRALAMRPGMGTRAYALAALLWLPVPVLAGALGFAAVGMELPISRPDMVGPQVAAALLGGVGAVAVFIIVFASIASSVDSLLAASSDLVTKEVFHRVLRPDATSTQIRAAAPRVIITTAFLAWAICLPKLGSLASVLFFSGPLVASTIWPVLAGLYWRRAHPRAALLAMLLGSTLGLWTYFAVGWFAASLASASISALVTSLGALFSDERFDFDQLSGGVTP